MIIMPMTRERVLISQEKIPDYPMQRAYTIEINDMGKEGWIIKIGLNTIAVDVKGNAMILGR